MTQNQSHKRTYDSSLRKQQQELTTKAIMAAVEKLILEGQIHNFTIQKVAKVAGVSYASIYRHFPSREALITGYRDWSMEHVAPDPPKYVDKLDELPQWVERTVPMLMEYLPNIRALGAALAALQVKDVNVKSRERDEWISRLVNEGAPSAPEHIRQASASLIRLLVSTASWVELHTRYGLSESEIITTVTEAIRAQILYLKTVSKPQAREYCD